MRAIPLALLAVPLAGLLTRKGLSGTPNRLQLILWWAGGGSTRGSRSSKPFLAPEGLHSGGVRDVFALQ
jgi:hypothetical protein